MLTLADTARLALAFAAGKLGLAGANLPDRGVVGAIADTMRVEPIAPYPRAVAVVFGAPKASPDPEACNPGAQDDPDGHARRTGSIAAAAPDAGPRSAAPESLSTFRHESTTREEAMARLLAVVGGGHGTHAVLAGEALRKAAARRNPPLGLELRGWMSRSAGLWPTSPS